jgi:uncharacterized membrane protein YhaH (DUF805 family)
MNLLVSFASTQGRIARKPFALGVLSVYVAGVAAQALLFDDVMARFGLWPFVIVQAALIWAWLVLHIRRLRDAGQGPAAAIGVALIYILALGLLLMLIVFFTNPDAASGPVGENPAGDAASATLLVLFLFAILFKPDFGVFTTILKGLILIAFMPLAISLLFSIRTGMRRSVP